MSTSRRPAAPRRSRLWILPALAGALAVGCAAPGDTSSGNEMTSRLGSALSNGEKRPVCDHIKSVASGHGVTNPLLFAGVPNHESGLVQCWKDATWACQGPHSDYCGGPVIAGSGDGPCSLEQGGLGMYQLDAGTYTDTLATYGNDVVELHGQIDKGVGVIVQKVWHCPNTPHFNNEGEVVAWLNGATPGTGDYEVFLSAMAYCYNGCQPGWSCYEPMRANYRAGVQGLLDAFGQDYWYGGAAAPPPPPPPAPTGCGILNAGQGLAASEASSSCSGTYSLVMQTDGNLVLYHNGVGAIWATGTDGQGGSSAVLQDDGNFVLYTAASAPLWSSGTSGHGGSYLAIQDDGNLVVYAPGGAALWDSHTNGR